MPVPTRLRALAAALLALVAAPAPAWGQPAPPAVSAPTPADAPRLGFTVLPLPFVVLAAGASYENFAIGPTRHEVRFLGGYYWSRNYYYDPLGLPPVVLMTPEGDRPVANTWQARANWGLRLTPWATLYADGIGLAGGPMTTGGYDDPLDGGMSAAGGPLLQLSTLDDPAFPLARAGRYWGRHLGPASFDFERDVVDASAFLPLGGQATLALRAVHMQASPQLAWLDKFSAGGGQFLRGFQWNRFTGDRLLSGTVELRKLIEPDVFRRLGLAPQLPGLTLGVASATFVDVGRAWETRTGLGVPFPQDVRVGGGTGLIALINGVPAGRVELNASGEGVLPMVAGGMNF